MDNKRFLILLSILLALLLTIVILTQVTGAKAETALARTAFVVLENRNGILNVRTAPVDGEVKHFLLDGWDIAVLDTLDNWALVCHGRDCAHPIGWVCMDYIHIYGCAIEYELEGMQ